MVVIVAGGIVIDKSAAAGRNGVMRVLLMMCVIGILMGVAKKVQTLPESRGGQELVGKKLPPLKFDRWVNTPGQLPVDAAGEVTLYRWWTSGCPFCEASLPALEKLRQKYEPQGLKVVAVYHPKPPGAVADEKVAEAAGEIGCKWPIAIDLDWSELKKAYPGNEGPTSISVLVDRQGVIRFVHPGPDLFPSDDKEKARQDEDYRLLEKAVEAVLK